MGNALNDAVAHRGGHAFDGVRAPEERRDMRGVAVTLTREERGIQLGEVLASLRAKELGVAGLVHATDPFAAYAARIRFTASRTRLGWNGFTTKSFAPA